MSDRSKRRRRWWLGTILLLGLPAAAVAALAIYVHMVNASPQNGLLRVRIQPEVVFPWQEAHFLATLSGDSARPVPKPEPFDIAFLVDVSGSMTKSIPTMANAV